MKMSEIKPNTLNFTIVDLPWNSLRIDEDIHLEIVEPERRYVNKICYSSQTSFSIRMKSTALSIPTNWHLLESHTAAIDIP